MTDQFFLEYGLFLAEALTVLALIVLLIGLMALSRKRMRAPEMLEIKHLNSHYTQMTRALKMQMLPKKAFAKECKAEKRQEKQRQKSGKSAEQRPKCIFVLDFQGDIRATAVNALREEVTAILNVATPEDEVLLRLENAGGLVHDHGLAASQLARLREQRIPLTVAVDKVAASGGYLMACLGHQIIAAPFAIIGSIGALIQLPNLHRLLDKHGIDFEQIKAGDLKRTLTVFGANTENDREEAKKQVEDIHHLFKEFVVHYRPSLDLSQIATGQHWHALRAKDLALVDTLQTSDDYLLEASKAAAVFSLKYTVKKPFLQKVLTRTQTLAEKVYDTFLPPL